jgi:hypothetical protein
MKYDVFISYSRKDFDEVSALMEAIRKEIPGLSMWFDVNGIESGDDFEEKIIDAIDNSSFLLFALSDNSLDSEWTKKEVMYAKNTGKRIVPVLLKGAQLKSWFLFKFSTTDCIDSTNRIHMEKLCRNLSDWIGRKPVITPSGAVVLSRSLCPCGSGRLFEDCHGKISLQSASTDKSFDELLDSFLDINEESAKKYRYDIVTNGRGQVMLIIRSREQEPANPLLLVSERYDSLSILYRCEENAVYFDDMAEDAYNVIVKVDQVWVVEMSDDGLVREYKVPVRIVKDVKVFM